MHLLSTLEMLRNMSRVMRKTDFCIRENKDADSCAVNAQMISTLVFALQIVQSLFFLNPKFQASSLFLRLYRSVCVRSGKPKDLLSLIAAQIMSTISKFSGLS